MSVIVLFCVQVVALHWLILSPMGPSDCVCVKIKKLKKPSRPNKGL
jgi:hypothetical protein